MTGSLLDRLGGLWRRKTICSVCLKAPASGVYSSRYGPVSHAACDACAGQGAEPLYMVCFHIHRAGGPGAAQERFANATSFHDGRYIGLKQILEAYPQFSDEFDEG
ncbi:MAG: hypothetical protein ISR44_03695 [Rhodospirillales bacterium]|nr:hypothetical protein [Rhodospirillales bacterium]